MAFAATLTWNVAAIMRIFNTRVNSRLTPEAPDLRAHPGAGHGRAHDRMPRMRARPTVLGRWPLRMSGHETPSNWQPVANTLLPTYRSTEYGSSGMIYAGIPQ